MRQGAMQMERLRSGFPAERGWRESMDSREPGMLAARAPIPVIGVDREGSLIYVNESVCALTGLDRDDLLGRRFWVFLGGRRGQLLKERFLLARDGEIFTHFEMPLRTVDDEEVFIEWYNVPFRDGEGRLTEVFSIGTDRTPLRRAEIRLERLYGTLDALGRIARLSLRTEDPRELLRSAVAILTETRICTEAWIVPIGDDGHPVGIVGSPRREAASSRPAEGGFTHLPLCIPGAIEGSLDITVSETSEACTECQFCPSGPDVHRVSISIGHGDRIYAVLGAHVRDPQLEGEEVKQLFRTIASDIGFTLAMREARAMHDRAEHSLAEQSRMLDAFFEASLDPAAILDPEFNFLRVNRAYADSDGREPCDFVGLNHFDLYPSEENQRIFERVRDTGEPYEVRARLFIYPENPTRGPTYWDWTLVPVMNSNGVVESLSLWLRDVTEECIAQEELRRSQETLRELGAQLALTEQRERREIAIALHDSLGQTLAFSKMKLGSIADSAGSQSEDIEEVIDLIDDAIRSTRSLTSQLSPPVLDGMGLIPAFEWLAEDMMKLHSVAIRIDCGADPGRFEEEIEATLFQATRELLNNAIKHADPEQVSLHFTLKDDLISIVVEDDGDGFDPSSLRESRSPHDGGFGLLNVQSRIGYLGGELQIESAPGAGSTIRLICPCRDRECPQ